MSTQQGHVSSTRTRHRSGKSDIGITHFTDSEGRRISNAQVYAEVSAGADYFWNKRPSELRPKYTGKY